MKASYSLKMKPPTSKPDSYEMDSVWVEVDEEDVVNLPDDISLQHKSLVLSYSAYRLVLLNAAILGVISADDASSLIRSRLAGVKQLLPASLHEFLLM